MLKFITRTVTLQTSNICFLGRVTLPSVNPEQAAGFRSTHAKTKCKHEQNDLHNCSSSKYYQVVKTLGIADATITTTMSSFLVSLHNCCNLLFSGFYLYSLVLSLMFLFFQYTKSFHSSVGVALQPSTDPALPAFACVYF